MLSFVLFLIKKISPLFQTISHYCVVGFNFGKLRRQLATSKQSYSWSQTELNVNLKDNLVNIVSSDNQTYSGVVWASKLDSTGKNEQNTSASIFSGIWKLLWEESVLSNLYSMRSTVQTSWPRDITKKNKKLNPRNCLHNGWSNLMGKPKRITCETDNHPRYDGCVCWQCQKQFSPILWSSKQMLRADKLVNTKSH